MARIPRREVGHLTVELDGPPDGEGAPGHVEGITSGFALARDGAALVDRGDARDWPGSFPTVPRWTPPPSARRQTGATRRANPPRSRLERDRGHLAGLVNVLNPQVLVLGGAIADHRPDLHAAVRFEIARRALQFPPPGSRSGPRSSGQRLARGLLAAGA